MKISGLLAFALLSVGAIAQQGPFELPSHRSPSPVTGGNVLIKNVKILTVTRGTIPQADVLILRGRIASLGKGLAGPKGIAIVDGTNKVLMPGIIDTHTHRGIEGVNEGADPITAECRVIDALNPDSKSWWQALASGHTSGLFLHGSANQIGGESLVAKYKYRRPVAETVFVGAPRMIKFALGENVTNKNSTTSTSFPRTRLGVEAGYRRAFQQAKEYRERQRRGEKVQKDVRLETLADILDRKIWVQCHSYRADEMLMMVRLSQEFGFKLGAMQHALEAYKIAPEMAKAGVGAAMFVDNWAFKFEAFDAIPFNAAICQDAGVTVSVNTDGLGGTTALNLDAARAMHYGGVTEDQALAMLTINAARQLGIAPRVGSIEVGKDADLSLWDGHPLSVRSKPVMTFIDGEVFFQRRDAFMVDGLSRASTSIAQSAYMGAQTLPKASSYAITNATIFPVVGPKISNGTLLVQNGKITAMGAKVAIPAGSKVVVGRGLSVMPGFIDAADNIGIVELAGTNQLTDGNEVGDYQPDLDCSKALFVENMFMGPALYNGVTHSFSRANQGVVSGQGALIRHAGHTTEELTVKAKAALAVNFPMTIQAGGFGFDDLCCGASSWSSLGLPWLDGRIAPPSEHSPVDGEDDALGGQGGRQGGQTSGSPSALQAYFDKVREYARGPRFPKDLSYEAMIRYVEGAAPIIFRVRNVESIRAAIEFGQKNKVRFALEGADDAWRIASEVKKAGVVVILNPAGRSTLSANNPVNDWDPYDTPYVVPYLLHRAGIPFCFTAGGTSEAMSLPFRVGTHLAYGLPWDAAIKSLTETPAKLFGVQDSCGSLKVGMPANFIVVAGDPLEPTSNVRYVFMDGKPVSLVNRQTMLRDKYWSRLKQ